MKILKSSLKSTLLGLLSAVCVSSALAAPVTVGNYSFETPQLGTTGTTWNNTEGAPWTETTAGGGDSFVEYIANFFSSTPDQANNRQHLGMNLNYDVWQNIPATTFTAGTTYTLTVAVGNRTGSTNAANSSVYTLADALPGATTNNLLVTGNRNASTVTAGTFADAPAIVAHVPPGSALIGKQIRILLQARGTAGRSHFDNIRLDASPMGTSLPGVITTDATAAGVFSATLNGTVTQVGSSTPAVTVYYGTTDAGPTETGWTGSQVLGNQSAGFSFNATGLQPSATYFYRVKSVNSTGTTWSVPAHRVSTGQLVSSSAPTNLAATTATVNGTILSTAEGNPDVTYFYGLTDGGTNPAAWQYSVTLGPQTGAFSANLSELIPSSSYFYRARAVVAAGTGWSIAAQKFTTAAPAVLTAVTVGNYSFELPNAPTTGTSWNNAEGAPWQEPVANGPNSFVEYSAPNFFANAPFFDAGSGLTLNDQYLGVVSGYDVWQDLGETYAAGTGYMLQVSIGNRSGFTDVANASTYSLAETAQGSVLDFRAANGGQLAAVTTFVETPANVLYIPPGSPQIGKTIRVLLQARGPNRSHFDNIRVSKFAMDAGLPGGYTTGISGLGGTQVNVDGVVSQVGSADPVVTVYYGPTDAGGQAAGWASSLALPGTWNGNFSGTLAGLSPGRAYFYRAKFSNATGATWSVVPGSFTTPPAVQSHSVTNVTASSAQVNGSIASATGAELVLYYGLADQGQSVSGWLGSILLGNRSDNFHAKLSGLMANTTYFYRWAASATGTGWSTAGSFTTTTANLPTVKTLPATNVDRTDAELNGEVTSTGGDVPAVTFYWGPTDGANIPGGWLNSQSVGLQGGKFSWDITGLTGASTYYFNVAAANGAGIAWGTSQSFIIDAVTAPRVENRAATHVTNNMATLNGEVTSDGDETPTVSFFWGDNDGVTTAGNWDTQTIVGQDSGDFSRVLLTLTPATTYYFRAYASNSAGTAWAAETATFTTAATSIAADLVISEIFYDPINPTYFTEFVELHNPTANPINLAGYSLGGDISYTFTSGSVAAGGHIVVVQHLPAYTAAYPGLNAAGQFGPWTRVGRTGGPENHILRNSNGSIAIYNGSILVDAVDYDSGFPWPTASKGTGTAHNNSQSHQLIHPALDSQLGASWRSAVVTPQASNSTVAVALATTAPPAVRGVSHTPNEPKAGEAVVITAKITDPEGVTGVNLLYAKVDPGVFIHKADGTYAASFSNTLPMNDGGTNGDAVAGDSIYSTTVPAVEQTHRRLVRYRIQATDGTNSITVPYADDEQPNFAYFVYNGVPAWQGRLFPASTALTGTPAVTVPQTPLQSFSSGLLSSIPPWHLLCKTADLVACQYTDGTTAARYNGCLVYDGKVYDHIQFANRGIGSTYNTGKNKWKLFMNRARNIRIKDNWGRYYDESWNSLGIDANAYPWASAFRGGAGIEEAAAYRAYELAGMPSLRTTYIHLRVIDNATEVGTPGATVSDPAWTGGTAAHTPVTSGDGQYSGDFYGLYMVLEPMESNFLPERGLEQGSIYSVEGNAGDKKAQGPTHSIDNTDYNTWRDAVAAALPGNNEAWYRANLDLKSLFDYMAVNRLVGNVDVRPGDNWRTYRRPTDNRWVSLPYDLDMMFFPAHHWGGAMDGITVAGAPNTVRAMMRHPEIAKEYRNRCREILSLMGSDASVCGGQIGQLLDEYTQMVNPTGQSVTWSDADAALWNLNPRSKGSLANTGQNNGRGNFFRAVFLDGTRGGLGGTTQTGTWIRSLSDPNSDGLSDHEGLVEYFINYATNTYPATAAPWLRKATTGAGTGNDTDVNRQKGYGYKYLEWEGFYGGYFNANTNPTFATPNIDLNSSGVPVFPSKPTLSYTGAAAFAANDLRFTSGDFTDIDGNNTIAAVQFRIGEISGPGIPGYDPTKPRIYEVEDLWTSTEIATASPTGISSVRIPASSVRVGDTYRARVRHKDNTGRWSYWSEPVQFVVGLPDITVYENSIVISEINYHPADPSTAEAAAGFTTSDFEFIELKNITNLPVDMTDVRFTKGADVDFPANFSISGNGFALVVRNLAAFQMRYGNGWNSIIAGTFAADELQNGGENVKLSYGTGTAIRDFTYSDTSPWPLAPDGNGPTLVLVDPASNPNHGAAVNWRASYLDGGSPGTDDVFNYAAWSTLNPNTADPEADQDHDGIVNRLEFAFGGDPNLENSIDGGNGILPAGMIANNPAGAPAGDYLTISFTRPNQLSGLTYTAEFSTDLAIWVGGMVQVSSVDNGNDTTTEVWRTPASVAATVRYFIHVKVSIP